MAKLRSVRIQEATWQPRPPNCPIEHSSQLALIITIAQAVDSSLVAQQEELRSPTSSTTITSTTSTFSLARSHSQCIRHHLSHKPHPRLPLSFSSQIIKSTRDGQALEQQFICSLQGQQAPIQTRSSLARSLLKPQLVKFQPLVSARLKSIVLEAT